MILRANHEPHTQQCTSSRSSRVHENSTCGRIPFRGAGPLVVTLAIAMMAFSEASGSSLAQGTTRRRRQAKENGVRGSMTNTLARRYLQENEPTNPPTTPKQPTDPTPVETPLPTKAPVAVPPPPPTDPPAKGNPPPNNVPPKTPGIANVQSCDAADTCDLCTYAALAVHKNDPTNTCQWVPAGSWGGFGAAPVYVCQLTTLQAAVRPLLDMCSSPASPPPKSGPPPTTTTVPPSSKGPGTGVPPPPTKEPTKAPVPAPTKAPETPSPTKAPMKTKTADPTKAPAKVDTSPPSKAPAKNDTPPPSKAPTTKNDTPPPSKAPTDNNPVTDFCQDALSCQDCKTAAGTQEGSTTKTCRWEPLDENVFICILKDPSNNDLPSLDDMCSSSSGSQDYTEESSLPFGSTEMIGVIAIVIVFAVCRMCCKSGGGGTTGGDPSKHTRAAPTSSMFRPQQQESRYHGLSTNDPGDSNDTDDWGWGDDIGSSRSGDMEMSRVPASPTSSIRSSPSSSSRTTTTVPKPPTTRTSPGSSSRPTTLPVASSSYPKPKPPQKPKPPANDIFSDMGLSAKPTFGKKSKPTTTTRTLGAVPLAKSSSDDWGDDDDLDDLLNG